MKILLKLEALALFGFGIFLFSRSPWAWWWFPALLLAPDVSMLGYLGGPRAGAYLYNLFHHTGVALVLFAIGLHLENDVLRLTGIILISHSAMDRFLGYGLKYPDHFQHTHLGWIGRNRDSN